MIGVGGMAGKVGIVAVAVDGSIVAVAAGSMASGSMTAVAAAVAALPGTPAECSLSFG